ncbi:efflux RND transporter periplasmic adaptor subunit [Salegentibacter mishustinae]|uniref:RND transporter n=1 Tax=Salegentibacter mishustinae TaxID=270918 RepID=A0A0Q9Z3X9_9FLAO|nr:efflux RND transporter periplasmic adaptor subunit [Salegentibacter mishustinae]KRG27547.1 RND transporter [Salegentibacter mishustinae]PNW20396.1 RND transporter [Salegentibacter mishustinae]PZX63188.1 HlyD family secretion protein [Salegentibacter mishustinae]GGW92398.1 RND transporter [Salegentibacter mishustinae]
MKKKTLFIIIGIALALILLLIVGKKAGWFGKTGNFKEVEITKIEPIDIVETVSATGKIQPEIEVKLSSEVSGEIIELPVVEGQAVEKGDLLVRVNPDIYQSNVNRAQAGLETSRANYAQAQASLKQAEANYNRNKSLFEKGVISKAEWDRVVSEYEVAQANKESAYYNMQSTAATVKEATDNLGRTNIYAPMSGTISKLDAELGERVVGTQQMAGTEILRVANLTNMEVEVDVNENDIVKVQVGDSTIVEVDAYLGKEFRGIVTEISNSADAALTTDQVTNFKVKVRILEESYKDLLEGKADNYSPFRPGMTATVDIITNRKDNIIGVPISAIVIKNDTTATESTDQKYEAVFLMEGTKAELRRVTTGIQDDSNIEITEGLTEGETVITGPYNTVTKSLKEGDDVEVTNK